MHAESKMISNKLSVERGINDFLNKIPLFNDFDIILYMLYHSTIKGLTENKITFIKCFLFSADKKAQNLQKLSIELLY